MAHLNLHGLSLLFSVVQEQSKRHPASSWFRLTDMKLRGNGALVGVAGRVPVSRRADNYLILSRHYVRDIVWIS